MESDYHIMSHDISSILEGGKFAKSASKSASV